MAEENEQANESANLTALLSEDKEGSSVLLSFVARGDASQSPQQAQHTNNNQSVDSSAFSPTTLLNNLLGTENSSRGDLLGGLATPNLDDEDEFPDTDSNISFMTAMEDADTATLASNTSADIMTEDGSSPDKTESLRNSPATTVPFVPSLEAVISTDELDMTPRRSGRILNSELEATQESTNVISSVEDEAADASAILSAMLSVPPLEIADAGDEAETRLPLKNNSPLCTDKDVKQIPVIVEENNDTAVEPHVSSLSGEAISDLSTVDAADEPNAPPEAIPPARPVVKEAGRPPPPENTASKKEAIATADSLADEPPAAADKPVASVETVLVRESCPTSSVAVEEDISSKQEDKGAVESSQGIPATIQEENPSVCEKAETVENDVVPAGRTLEATLAVAVQENTPTALEDVEQETKAVLVDSDEMPAADMEQIGVGNRRSEAALAEDPVFGDQLAVMGLTKSQETVSISCFESALEISADDAPIKASVDKSEAVIAESAVGTHAQRPPITNSDARFESALEIPVDDAPVKASVDKSETVIAESAVGTPAQGPPSTKSDACFESALEIPVDDSPVKASVDKSGTVIAESAVGTPAQGPTNSKSAAEPPNNSGIVLPSVHNSVAAVEGLATEIAPKGLLPFVHNSDAAVEGLATEIAPKGSPILAIADADVGTKISVAGVAAEPSPSAPFLPQSNDEGHFARSASPPNDSDQINEIFRPKTKPKALQLDFPSVLDSGLKKSDVSLSSASSTISGSRLLSAYAPAGNVDDTTSRRSSNDTRPPRAPSRKGRETVSPKSLVETLSKKLNSSGTLSLDDSERAVESRWIKQAMPKSFNPRRSIFAGKQQDTSEAPEFSPPGSPPEPVYPESDIEESSASDESRETTSAFGAETTTWDMISESPGLRGEEIRPEFVVMPEPGSPLLNPAIPLGDDMGTESSILTTDNGSDRLPKQTKLKSHLSDVSHSSPRKRRGMIRALSFTSRGSGRRSLPSRGSLARFNALDPRIPSIYAARSDEPPSKKALSNESLFLVEDSLPKKQTGPSLSSSFHHSSPDLRQLIEQQDSEKLASDLAYSLAVPAIADAQPTDVISPESLAERYGKYADEAGPDRKGALLEEELLAFSSVKRVDLPFRYSNPVESVNYLGSLKWRQLVACWKHTEMCRAMFAQEASPHSVSNIEEYDTDDWSNSTTMHKQAAAGELVLGDVPLKEKRMREDLKNLDGFRSQQGVFKLSPISGFLAGIGKGWANTSGCALRHALPSGASITAQNLLKAVKAEMPMFASLVEETTAFSKRNHCGSRLDVETARFSIGVKEVSAIQRKAKNKYGGDILQVKDVLRAQITFSDELALVCGLVYLFRVAATPTEDGDSGTREEFDVVRMKNLFGSESQLGNMTESPLPTGYVHILLNIRTKGGVLAEIQFNLKPIFDILGSYGASLHRELVDFLISCGALDKASSLHVNGMIREAVGHEDFLPEDPLFSVLASKPLQRPLIDSKANPTETPLKISETPQKTSGHVGSHNTEEAAPILTPKSSEPAEALDTILKAGSNALESTVASFGSPATGTRDPSGGNNPDAEARKKMIKELCDHAESVNDGDVFLSILEHGSRAASEKPRDVSTFYCLYVLFSHIVGRESADKLSSLGFGVRNKADVVDHAQRCLLRCLTISNQAISTGMTGWLEYGCSTPLDRLTERPFVLIRHLAYDFGRRGQWNDAECVLQALVARCEQRLPMYHPTTLTSLLDLAIVAQRVGKVNYAERIVSRVADRLSTYLSEMESSYFSHLAKYKSGGKPGGTVFRIDHGRDSIFMLQSFVSLFEVHLDRAMGSLVGQNNDILLLNHCFMADALSVLANCKAAARSVVGSTAGSISATGTQVWKMAHGHYMHAFNGFIKTRGMDDPSATRAAYGLARCLREFGETEKALELLSLIVSFTEKAAAADPDVKATSPTVAAPQINKDIPFMPRFLPESMFSSSKAKRDKALASKHTSSALCLWLMAILSLDKSPNDEGRDRAFSYLHAASVSLQTALSKVSDEASDDDATRVMCVQFLAMIEEEAMQIAEPIDEE